MPGCRRPYKIHYAVFSLIVDLSCPSLPAFGVKYYLSTTKEKIVEPALRLARSRVLGLNWELYVEQGQAVKVYKVQKRYSWGQLDVETV